MELAEVVFRGLGFTGLLLVIVTAFMALVCAVSLAYATVKERCGHGE